MLLRSLQEGEVRASFVAVYAKNVPWEVLGWWENAGNEIRTS